MEKLGGEIFIIFSVGDYSAVSSADNAEVMESDIDESIDLSNANDEMHSLENENVNSNEEMLGSGYNEDLIGEQHVEQQQQDPEQEDSNNNFVIVNKNWKGNYSGDIGEIEIQLLKKLNPGSDNPKVPEPCPSPVIQDRHNKKLNKKPTAILII